VSVLFYFRLSAVINGSSSLAVIDQFVTRGSHFVDCVLLGDEGQSVPPFKIIGVFAT
jgi:hypothetical protein